MILSVKKTHSITNRSENKPQSQFYFLYSDLFLNMYSWKLVHTPLLHWVKCFGKWLKSNNLVKIYRFLIQSP